MDEQPVFKALWHLIGREKIAIGILATAIEEKGVQGWDRFGRFKTFKADSSDPEIAEKYNKVLDTLAEQHEWDQDPQPDYDSRSPMEEADAFPDLANWLNFGWLENDLPNFSEFSSESASQPAAPQKPSNVNNKGEHHSMRLIAALLEVIDGKAFGNKHPDWKSAQDLAKELEAIYQTRIGTADSLVKKFSAARKQLQDRIDNL